MFALSSTLAHLRGQRPARKGQWIARLPVFLQKSMLHIHCELIARSIRNTTASLADYVLVLVSLTDRMEASQPHNLLVNANREELENLLDLLVEKRVLAVKLNTHVTHLRKVVHDVLKTPGVAKVIAALDEQERVIDESLSVIDRVYRQVDDFLSETADYSNPDFIARTPEEAAAVLNRILSVNG